MVVSIGFIDMTNFFLLCKAYNSEMIKSLYTRSEYTKLVYFQKGSISSKSSESMTLPVDKAIKALAEPI